MNSGGEDDPLPTSGGVDPGSTPAGPPTAGKTRGSGSNLPDTDPPKSVVPVKQEPVLPAEVSVSLAPRTITATEAYTHEVPGDADSTERNPAPGSDASSITLSGARIAAMIAANPQRVTFIVDGVPVLVNSEDLLALGIRDDQLLSVLLTDTDNGVAVRFLLDGVEVALPCELPTTTQETAESAQEIQADTKPVSPTQTDLPAEPSCTPFLPLVAGVVPVGAVSAWLCRKRLIKR